MISSFKNVVASAWNSECTAWNPEARLSWTILHNNLKYMCSLLLEIVCILQRLLVYTHSVILVIRAI